MLILGELIGLNTSAAFYKEPGLFCLSFPSARESMVCNAANGCAYLRRHDKQSKNKPKNLRNGVPVLRIYFALILYQVAIKEILSLSAHRLIPKGLSDTLNAQKGIKSHGFSKSKHGITIKVMYTLYSTVSILNCQVLL